MIRTLAYLSIAAAIANAPGSCSHGDKSSAGTSGTSGAAASGDWPSLGATACAKYITPDMANALLSNPPGTPKTLSNQSCALHTDAGDISITLMNDDEAGFDAFIARSAVDPHPLAGVGDKAQQSMIGIAAFKKPGMVCTIDAAGAPGFLKQSDEQLGQSLGAICNKLFAARP